MKSTVYVINLKRRYNQYEIFLKNNKDIPLKIVRFEAIDGLIENNNQIVSIGKNPVHKQTKHGRFGCFLSHLAILRKIAENNEPDQWSFISEDDTIISPELFGLWDNIIAQTKKYNINILLLSRTYAKKDKMLYPLVNGLNILAVDDIFFGTHFYAVTGKGANVILGMEEMNPYGSVPYDLALGLLGKKEKCVYSAIKYDPNNYDSLNRMYSKHILAYASVSGKMKSSTEEYYENIKENFKENKQSFYTIAKVTIMAFIITLAVLISLN